MTRPRAPRPACLHVLEAVYSGGRSVTTGLRQTWFRLASALYWACSLDDLCDLLESQIFTRVTWSKQKDKVSGIQPGCKCSHSLLEQLWSQNDRVSLRVYVCLCMFVCAHLHKPV